MMRTIITSFLGFFLAIHSLRAQAAVVSIEKDAPPRVEYGAQQVAAALKAQGIDTTLTRDTDGVPPPGAIVVRREKTGTIKPQGFSLKSDSSRTAVQGGDDAGMLYGCLELAQRITESKGLPALLDMSDAPSMPIRGTCVAMQKPYKLPGRKVYEYPYTPDLFPFFYDKPFWTAYLDFLAKNRFNMLYLWNGHPFASLVRVPDYPYAVEVPDDVLAKNQEMFNYILAEADKRGITVMQMFYNILVSKPFAEKNNLSSTQFAAPTPLIADYTRKSIAEFVKTYPKAGLMICLGEALKDGKDEGDPNRQANWMTQVIVPGIKDGMAQANLKEEIPVLLRAHAMPATDVLPQVLKVYKNISTESKYNGESLTTWEPRGEGAEEHVTLSKLAPHLVNVHILANLEPFRYGAQRFIKLCVQASEDRLGATGVHLYPLFYWDWPDSPDKTATPLKQWERDWIWYESWARYEWNPHIDETMDHQYWVQRIAEMYGSGAAAEKILAAYNDSGECAPRIIRRFGITEGNRQTMSLGMTLDQLVNAPGAFSGLWEWQSPPGERLQEYITKEFHNQPHEGETPPQIIREILDFSKKAVDEIDAAAPLVTKNKEEFARLQNDMHCIRAMSESYGAKANAAGDVLRYNLSKDSKDMQQAEKDLGESLQYFRELTALTKDTYKFANGMQTTQRKVPFPGGTSAPGGGEQPANYHWTQLLPQYEKEYSDFQNRVKTLTGK
ncbi:MAG TPA: glycoside hydrolase family 20 zincin-like fold domain-containing protein [Phycisphaerae bacterium]|jgi:hypothetical protein